MSLQRSFQLLPCQRQVDGLAVVAQLLLHAVDDQLQQLHGLYGSARDLEDSSSADRGDELTDLPRPQVTVVMVEVRTRMQRQKSLVESDLHQLIDEAAQHINEMIGCIWMPWVYFQGM